VILNAFGIYQQFRENAKNFTYLLTYDEDLLDLPNSVFYVYGTCWIKPEVYKNIDTSRKKPIISSITGSKEISPAHTFRKFSYDSQCNIPLPITWFRSSAGDLLPEIQTGQNPILGNDKAELFLDYQFALVIENSRQNNYFSEKLIDCLVTKTIPIYYGCPNISKWFDTTGWIILETTNVDELILKGKNLPNYEDLLPVIQKNWRTAQEYTCLETNINRALAFKLCSIRHTMTGVALVPNMAGGLCNVMFQLASIYCISKSVGCKFMIAQHEYRSPHNPKTDLFETVLSKWKRFHHNVKPAYVHHEYKLHPLNMNPKPGVNLICGYFQNHMYIDPYKSEILDMFSFDTTVVQRYPRLHESAYIHVRGGDYIQNPVHFIDFSKYYPRAIEILRAPHYYIFTNDVEFLKTHSWLSDIEYTVVDENEINSLYLMSKCEKGAICANSSFSWWGAYMNTERPICMPSKWFNDTQLYTTGFYFPGVTKIDV